MTEPLILAVPNISEGRDEQTIRRIGHARELLDVHSDPDHNRSVLTYGTRANTVIDVCFRMIERAVAQLDITKHDGAHPRYGVVDVLPLVPYGARDEDAHRVAGELTWRIAQGPGVPVYPYGRLSPEGRSLPDLRRWLRETRPPTHPTAGVICIGIREPLIAFNVNVRGSIDAARRMCASLRTLPGVRALAFVLPSRGLVQVSMNLISITETGPASAYRHVSELAPEEHLEIVDAEVVGLVPRTVLHEFDAIPLFREVRTIEDALRGS